MSWIKKSARLLFAYLVAPIAMLLMLLGGSLLIVASPAMWSYMYDAPEKLGEFAQEDGELIAEHLWTTKPYSEVSRELQGGRLVHREVVHYEDLQEKFVQLKILVVTCSAIALLSLCFQFRRRVVLASLSWLGVICAVGGVWSMYNWRGMFRALHWWIFQDDSWILPWGCYSLRLYPYSVWKGAMVWMVVISAGAYLFLWILSALLNKRARL
jgi:hypothetical protein